MSLDPTAELNALRTRVSEIEQKKKEAMEQAESQWKKDYEEAVRVRKIAVERASSPDQKEKQKSRLQQTIQYYEKMKPQKTKSVAASYDKELRQIKTDMDLLSGLTTRPTPESKLDLALSYADRSKYAAQYAKSVTPDSANKMIDTLSRGNPDQYAKGSEKNVWKNKLKYQIKGYGTAADFQKIREAEIQNRKQGMKKSAGIAAGGVQHNFNQGYTTQSKTMGYSTTGQAEVERQNKVAQFIANKQVEQANKNPIKHENKGSGTTTDPFRAQQPDSNLLSPYLTNNQKKISYQVTTPDGDVRIFKSKESAEKFISRVEKSEWLGTSMNPYKGKQPDPNLLSPYLKQNQYKNAIVTKISDKILGFVSLDGSYLIQEGTTTIKQKDSFIGPKQQKKNFLDQTSDYLVDFTSKTKNPILKFFGGTAKEGVSAFASLVNLERIGGELFQDAIKPKTRIGSYQSLKVIETAPGKLIEGPISGTVKTFQTGDFGHLVKETKKSISATNKLIQEQGFAETAGQTLAFIAPTGKLPVKAVPLRVESFKVLTESGKSKTIIRTLEAGYGKNTKPIIGKADNIIFLGKENKIISRSSLKEIESVDRGLELSTPGKLGVRVLTSKEGLEVLSKAGKLLPRDVKAIPMAKEMAEIISFSQRKVSARVRTKAETLPDKPLTSVLAGPESKALKEKIITALPTKKGTLSETLQLEDDLIKQIKPSKGLDIRSNTTGDLDVDFGHLIFGGIRAKRAADKAIEIFQRVAESNRQFFKPIKIKDPRKIVLIKEKKLFGSTILKERKIGKDVIIFGKKIYTRKKTKLEGTNVFSQTKGEKEEEVLNILTKRDAKKGYLNPISKPFGINLGSKKVKVKASEESTKKADFVTLEQNALNRIESVLSLQGPKSQKFKGETKDIPYLNKAFQDKGIQTTSKGYTVISSEHRLKDMSKLLSQDTEQIARNLIKSGYEKEGKRMRELTKQYKDLYPEVEFDEAVKAYPEEIGYVSYPSKLSSVGSTGKKLSPLSGNLARVEEPKEKTVNDIRKEVSTRYYSKSPYKNPVKKLEVKSLYTEAAKKLQNSLSKTQPRKLSSFGSSLGSKGRGSVSKSTLDNSSLLNSRGLSKGSTGKSSTGKSSIGSASALSIGSVGGPSVGSPSSGSPGSPGSSGSRFSSGRVGFVKSNIPSILNTKRQPLGIIPRWKTDKSFGAPRPKKRRYDYIGNVPIDKVTGVFKKRSETVYGKSKISFFVSKDRQQTKKDYSKNLLDFKESNKKSKSFLRL